jgi:4-hydroxy-tetrahydrodipicolinate synthase
MTPLHGVIPMLVTPFAHDGAVAHDELAAIAELCLGAGAAAIAVGGLASEVGTLTADERVAMTATVLGAAAGSPVVVGCSASDTATSIQLATAAANDGASVVMIAPPNRPDWTREEVHRHFAAVAQAIAPTPVMVQDAPAYVGVTLEADFVTRLADEHPNVRYAKPETTPAADAVTYLAGDPRLRVFGGQGGIPMLDVLAAGGHGIIPGCDVPEEFVEIFAAWRRGDEEAARTRHTKLLPLLTTQFQSLDCYIASVKAVLVWRGLITHGALRGKPAILGPAAEAALHAHASRSGALRPR